MEKDDAARAKPRSRRLLIIIGFLILPIAGAPAVGAAAEWARTHDFLPEKMIDPSVIAKHVANKAVEFLQDAWRRYRGD